MNLGILSGLNGLATGFGKGLGGTAQAVGQGFNNVVNRAGEATYDAGEMIGHAANFVSDHIFGKPFAMPDKWAAYPSYMRGDVQPVGYDGGSERARYQLGTYAPETLPKVMPAVQGYRADPTGRFGGKDGLETQPYKYLDPVELYAHVRAMARGAELGVPQLTSQQLAALALKEGKSFFGVNPNLGKEVTYYDPNDKTGKDIHEKLVEQGLDNRSAGFASYLSNKQRLADRLKIPFAEAWNGTGKTEEGTSGKDYAKSYDQFLKAAANPKNKALVDFIQSAIDAEKPKKK